MMGWLYGSLIWPSGNDVVVMFTGSVSLSAMLTVALVVAPRL